MLNEDDFKRLTKVIKYKDLSDRWKVLFDGVEIGHIEKLDDGYNAINSSGKLIGVGYTKGESKMFLSEEFYGIGNVKWRY